MFVPPLQYAVLRPPRWHITTFFLLNYDTDISKQNRRKAVLLKLFRLLLFLSYDICISKLLWCVACVFFKKYDNNETDHETQAPCYLSCRNSRPDHHLFDSSIFLLFTYSLIGTSSLL